MADDNVHVLPPNPDVPTTPEVVVEALRRRQGKMKRILVIWDDEDGKTYLRHSDMNGEEMAWAGMAVFTYMLRCEVAGPVIQFDEE